jgi:hypothetical protein
MRFWAGVYGMLCSRARLQSSVHKDTSEGEWSVVVVVKRMRQAVARSGWCFNTAAAGSRGMSWAHILQKPLRARWPDQKGTQRHFIFVSWPHNKQPPALSPDEWLHVQWLHLALLAHCFGGQTFAGFHVISLKAAGQLSVATKPCLNTQAGKPMSRQCVVCNIAPEEDRSCLGMLLGMPSCVLKAHCAGAECCEGTVW